MAVIDYDGNPRRNLCSFVYLLPQTFLTASSSAPPSRLLILMSLEAFLRSDSDEWLKIKKLLIVGLCGRRLE